MCWSQKQMLILLRHPYMGLKCAFRVFGTHSNHRQINAVPLINLHALAFNLYIVDIIDFEIGCVGVEWIHTHTQTHGTQNVSVVDMRVKHAQWPQHTNTHFFYRKCFLSCVHTRHAYIESIYWWFAALWMTNILASRARRKISGAIPFFSRSWLHANMI